MMNSSIKKIILGAFLLGIAFTTNIVDAQTPVISNISIDVEQKMLNIHVNQTIPRADLALYFTDINTGGAGSEIDTIEWRKGDYAIGIQNFTITPPTISEAGQTFNYLNIQPSEGPESYIELEQLFSGAGGEGQTGNVTVDFPGWASSRDMTGWKEGHYCKKATSNEYYPCIKTTEALVRTPSSAPIHIILGETRSGEKALLKTYPAGSASFYISWPSIEEISLYGGLKPDTNYEIFLAEDEAGVTPVNFGSSRTTYMTLGSIPEVDTQISITNAVPKKTADGKNYYEISGKINAETKENTMIDFVVLPKGASTGGQLLGQIAFVKDKVFTVPNESDKGSLASLADGEYELSMKYTGPSGTPTLLPIVALPRIGEGTIDGQGSGAGGGMTPYVSPEQQEVLDKGIVPTDCGYNIGKGEGGRMCGFADIIQLIERGIKYIFVLMLPITAIVFAYAGFLFITSGGNSGKKTKAKKAMTSVLIGIIVVMAAFLMVRTLLVSLGVEPANWVYLDI